MKTWWKQLRFIVGLCALLGAGAAKAAEVAPERAVAQPQTAEARPAADSQADEKAIRATADEFVKAFAAADAKAVAALWTERGEYESDDGTVLRGRTAIEAAFAAHFKGRPAETMEIKIESIRFPSRDTAVEEGLTSTTAGGAARVGHYRVLHVREDGKWRIALCREWGAAENRMADLDWLIGTWRSQAKDHEMVISFAREKDGPFIIGEFTATAAGKNVLAGDHENRPRSGLGAVHVLAFRSRTEDMGTACGCAKRNHWVVDSRGIQGDGAETAAVNVLSRFGSDELGWRSLDRMVSGKAQPESPPIRLKRVADHQMSRRRREPVQHRKEQTMKIRFSITILSLAAGLACGGPAEGRGFGGGGCYSGRRQLFRVALRQRRKRRPLRRRKRFVQSVLRGFARRFVRRQRHTRHQR